MPRVASRCRQAGITLIELMVVVALLAIIASIALPSYSAYVQQARRSDALAALLALQLAQEKYRANNSSYAADLATLGAGASSAEGYYALAVASAAANSFVITAAPQGVQAGDGCGTFAVDENGPDYSGSYATASCWSR